MTRKKSRKTALFYFTTGIICILIIGTTISLNFSKKHKTIKQIIITNCDPAKNATAPITPQRKLNDQNDIQLQHAQANGLKKLFETDEEFESQIDSLSENYTLVEVTDNKFYQLKNLTHSMPYLVPEALDLLNEIGYRFQERLREKNYKNFRLRITSLLRTIDSQSKLSRRNFNAAEHSAHLYGTTFDISYKDFYNSDNDSIESSYEGVKTLTEVLLEMRQECKLLAVRERKQACFHITVVACKPSEE